MKTRISTSRLLASALLCSGGLGIATIGTGAPFGPLLLAAAGHVGEEKEGLEEREADGDDPGERMKFRRLQSQDENGRVSIDGLQKAREHVAAMKAAQQRRATAAGKVNGLEVAGINPGSWTWLGPGNIGGRIRSIVIDPADANKIWVGSVSGGIWKSTNAGLSWDLVTSFASNLVVSTMVMDPTNSSTMYVGTGESFSVFDLSAPGEVFFENALQGAGVFKSTNGGMSWNLLPATNPADVGICTGPVNCPWYYVNRLAISADGGTILAATVAGIHRSTDGGACWTAALSPAGNIQDVDFDPTDFTSAPKAIASRLDPPTAVYSLDGGATWTGAPNVFNPPLSLNGASGRIELAYAPSDPSIVYASVHQNRPAPSPPPPPPASPPPYNPTTQGDIYKSTDGGRTYDRLGVILTGNTFLGDQGGYGNIIWVNPQDPNFVIVGGVNMYRSTNGGINWQGIANGANGSAHSDHHMILASPAFNNSTNKQVYFTNDGGVYFAEDVSALCLTDDSTVNCVNNGWEKLNNHLGITQFWGAAANSAGVIVGGTQDNGNIAYHGDIDGWVPVLGAGGDGAFCAADPIDPNYLYTEYTYLQLRRSTDAGVPATDISSGIPEAGDKKPQPQTANFYAPFILDPNDPDIMLAGGRSLWRSTDIKAEPLPTWTAIKPPSGAPISAIAVSRSHSSFIVVGHNDGQIYLTLDGTGTNPPPVNQCSPGFSPCWQRISIPGNTPERFVTRLLIDETRGPNWIYATFGGFNGDNIYVTKDLGMTWSDVTGPDALTGLPDVPVRTLAINPLHPDYLYAGTEVGIFASEDAGATWNVSQDGPANISVDELFWLHGDLVAVTFGRGLYKASPPPGYSSNGGSGGGGGGACNPPPDCACFGYWSCPCSWNTGQVPEDLADVGLFCPMVLDIPFVHVRNLRVDSHLTVLAGLTVSGGLHNFGTITSNGVEHINLYVGGNLTNSSGLIDVEQISVQGDLINGGMLVLPGVNSVGRDLYMGSSSTYSGRTLSVGGNLTNLGNMEGEGLGIGPYGPHNLSGSGIWKFMNFSAADTETVSLSSDVTLDCENVTFYGTLNVGGKTLTNRGSSSFWTVGPVLGTGTFKFAPLSGSVQVFGDGPDVTVFSGTVHHGGGTIGALTVSPGTTLDINNSGHLKVNGNVTIDGTLSVPNGQTPSLTFNGSDFTNNGSVGNVYFLNFNLSGSPKTQTISGTGSWSPQNIQIGTSDSLTTVKLENDVTFASNQLITGIGSDLNVFVSTLTLTGPMTNFVGKITGSPIGLVRMQPSAGIAYLGIPFFGGSLTIDPSLEIVSGQVVATATTVTRNLLIDPGATLSLRGITVYGNVVNDGTLNTFSESPTGGAVFYGENVTNNGTIATAVALASDSPQNIAGTGSWVGATSALYCGNSPSSIVTLQNDVTYSGGTLYVAGRLNTGAFTLTMPCTVGMSPFSSGDVVGNIRRTNLAACPGTPLAFGNPYTTIQFTSGTPPTEINVKLALSAPPDFANAVQRSYTITPNGGSGYAATLRLHYLDSEINGNNESTLQLFRNDGTSWNAQGATTRDTTNNWVEYSGVTQFSPWTLSSLPPPAPTPTPTPPLPTPTPGPTTTPSGAVPVYGVSNGFGAPADNQLYQIDPANASLSGNVQLTLPGFTVFNALALTARPNDGTLFAVVQTATGGGSAFASRRLVTVNPTTGVCTDVGLLGGQAIASLSFRSNNVLYAVSGTHGPNPETLFTVNTITGAPTVAFALGNGADGETIAFHGNGLLYHSSGNGTAIFESIDVDTQVVTPIGTSNSESFCLGYRADTAEMYGSDIENRLYAVDIATGVRTIIGPFTPTLSGSNRGLAFVPTLTATPTPAPIIISGTISYCSNPVPGPVAGGTLTLTGTSGGATLSDGSGTYTFSSLASGGSYTVTPTMAALTPGSNGIDGGDVVAVIRHYLEFPPLIPAGCQLDAADADTQAVGIDGSDIVAIQRFYLGFPNSPTSRAGQYWFIPVSRAYLGLVSNQTSQNYDALIFGDVTGGFVHRLEGGLSPDAVGDGMDAGEVAATVAVVALPDVAVDHSRAKLTAAVTTSAIDATSELVGFQGNITFDERAITFQNPPVQPAGLTAGNWNVSGNVLPGPGPIRTLRLLGYSNDFTPLSGKGTLFELRMTRVSKAAQSAQLNWVAPPHQFLFIDADSRMQPPGNSASGSVNPGLSQR